MLDGTYGLIVRCLRLEVLRPVSGLEKWSRADSNLPRRCFSRAFLTTRHCNSGQEQGRDCY